jgi:hypothetical protein
MRVWIIRTREPWEEQYTIYKVVSSQFMADYHKSVLIAGGLTAYGIDIEDYEVE